MGHLYVMADKRRARYGAVGGNLTPKQAKEKLTLPLYAVITGQAHPTYPTGNLASPSALVSIVPNDGGCARTPDGRGTGLPCHVNGKQWQTAVVPVLQNPLWDPSNLGFHALAGSNWTNLLTVLGNAIAQSFSDAGYGPVDK